MHARVRALAGLVAWLSVAGAAGAAEPDLRLVRAAAEQDRETVRALLKQQKIDVNAARADGVTALVWAAHWNDLELVRLLLQSGANVNAADDYGVSPLARAAENASAPLVTTLLAHGANPNAAQKSGLTPLMIASRTGSADVVRALLDRGADVNATTTGAGATALMWALAMGHGDIVRLLVDRGARVDVSTEKGFTPLMFAARNGDIDLAKRLITAGADVNQPAADGTHVLPFAMLMGEDAFAHFLLEQGADPNGRVDGVTALHVASGSVNSWLEGWSRRRGGSGMYGATVFGMTLDAPRRLRLVKALLARGADPNARITTSAMFMSYIGYPKKGAFEPFACGTGDLSGATPLWVAAYSANGGPFAQGGFTGRTFATSSAEILQALLEAGANPHLTTVDGTTPLMVAAGLGRSTYTPREPRGVRSPTGEAAVKVLLEAGSDINAVNEADFTALHGAAFRGLNEIVTYLVEQGARLDVRDFRGRTPYRLAEGSKQSFQFQDWPETAELLKSLGANTRLGVPGTVQERARDLKAEAARLTGTQQ
jgi:ankyrin repeat protein